MPCGKNFKTYLFASFSAIGGFLFGYHTGVISGVLIMNDFKSKMRINYTCLNTTNDEDNFDSINGSIVGVLLFGCFLGSLIGGQTSDRFSRKYSIAAFSFIFIISAAVQTGSSYLVMLLVGRFFAGISIGALSMIIPMYHSEIAATKVRGRIITLQQLAITSGIAISFWINVATNHSPVKDTPWEWRIPFAVQMIPSLILAIGILFCPFSPRWLISHDREDEARNVLMKIRSASHNEIEEEMDRIKTEVAYLRENEIDSYRQLFRSPLLRPFILGIGIQVFQQLTGINSAIYFAPRIFIHFFTQSCLNSDPSLQSLSLTLTGVNGCVNVFVTISTVIFIDKFGRRSLLITGAIIMFVSMLIIAILMVFNMHPPVLRILFIYIFVGGFAFSWGPIPWIYCTEIFPLTMRAKATSLTTAANWATNCLVSFLVPTLLKKMNYGTFIMFSIFCAIMMGIVFLFYPETKNRHLEENNMVDSNRIFVPHWLENRRRHHNTFPEEQIVNQVQVPFASKQNSMDRSNQINNSDSTIQRDDYFHEKNLDRNETIN